MMKILKRLTSIVYCIVAFLAFAALNIYSTSYKTDFITQTVERIYNVIWKYIPLIILLLAFCLIIILFIERKHYFSNKHSIFTFICKYFVLLAGLVFSMLGYGDWDWQLIFTVACLALLVDFESIKKTALFFYLGIMGVTMILWVLGLANNVVTTRGNGTIRHSLGYVYTNTFSLMYVSLYFVLWMINKRKNIVVFTIAGIVLGITIWLITDSKSALGTLAVFLVLIWIREFWKKIQNGQILKQISKCIFILMPIICVLMTFLIGKFCRDIPGMDKSTFSVRFYEVIDVLRVHGVSFFGRNIEMPGNTILYFDNTYVKILFRNGMGVFLSVIILLVIANGKAVKNKNWSAAIVLLAVEIYSLMEQLYFRPIFVMLLMYVFAVDNDYLKCRETNGSPKSIMDCYEKVE